MDIILKNKYLNRFFRVLLEAVIILFVLNFSDYLYSIYNSNYIPAKFLAFEKYIFLIVISYILLEKRPLKILTLAFILTLMLLQFCHFQYFGSYIQPISFYQFFFNKNEVFLSFFDDPTIIIIPLAIVSLTFLITLKINAKFNNNLQKNYIGILILIGTLSFGILETKHNLQLKDGKLYHQRAVKLMPSERYNSTSNFIKSLNYFMVGILPKKLNSYQNKNFTTIAAPEKMTPSPNVNIIFIIGESLRAQNLSLLGYKENHTTPLLENLDQLYSSAVYSSGTMTKTSVPALINRLKYPGTTDQIQNQENCLFRLAKENGFQTHFYSAQSSDQLKIIQSLICKKYIDKYETRTTFESKNQYDLVLKEMISNVDLNNKNNFVILHQRGSHSPYRKSSPEEFKAFENQYDNTILYTDFVLTQIIDLIEKNTNKETYIIYTSDHGELLGEHGKKGHGWFYKEVYRVPFLFYKLNSKKSMKLDEIKSHFDISNLVTTLLGYKTTQYKDKEYYINGSDINALAGYLKIEVDDDGKEISNTQYR